ncbi:MAG TPA: hypothetical protein VLD62_11710 [Acidimicrobiia bacterium]|nr:hypothetical protein [Acidimicrobiia bacterium]
MRRISVVGVTGSGKSTFSDRLAGLLRVPHVELDALQWENGWSAAAEDVFVGRVRSATDAEAWVLAGNYPRVQPLVWERADIVVWLDPPLRVAAFRLLRRTFRRIRTRERLWGTDNVESLGRAFGRDSILRWLLKTFRKVRRRYEERFADPRWSRLDTIRLRRAREVEAFLAGAARGQAYPRSP